MKRPIFVTYSLVLVMIFMQTFLYLRLRFSGGDQMRARIAQLEKMVEQKDFSVQLSQYQLEDYRQQVATLMPNVLKERGSTPESFSSRNLASIVQVSDAPITIERASSLFEKGKKAFRENYFEKASEAFSQIISLYPESVHGPEARFLLAESQYQLKNFDECIETVDAMLDLYPENDLTGFALLRLGKVYEKQDRLEDAAEIYKTVLSSFQDPGLLQQAKTAIKAVEL